MVFRTRNLSSVFTFPATRKRAKKSLTLGTGFGMTNKIKD